MQEVLCQSIYANYLLHLHLLSSRSSLPLPLHPLFFFFNDTATTEIYTLSLHDALPISTSSPSFRAARQRAPTRRCGSGRDRKSTRLNSSHVSRSYAVFCLKKKIEVSIIIGGKKLERKVGYSVFREALS